MAFASEQMKWLVQAASIKTNSDHISFINQN